jgi:transcriptional regulator with XRE-family HTH domain
VERSATIGSRIRDLRKARGLSQQSLGDLASTDHSRISRIEAGKDTPTIPMLERLAAGLGVEVGELFAKGAAPRPEHPGAAALSEGIVAWCVVLAVAMDNPATPPGDAGVYVGTVGALFSMLADAADDIEVECERNMLPEERRSVEAALGALLEAHKVGNARIVGERAAEEAHAQMREMNRRMRKRSA